METGSPNQIVRADASGIGEFAYLAIDVPIGTVVPYLFPSPPVGFLVCDGSSLSRTAYADLFALANNAGVVGTLFGAGDGSTTFTLPDFSASGLATVSGVDYIIKATYSTLLGDSHAEASEAFTMFIGGQ